jgi:hypothetical protein
MARIKNTQVSQIALEYLLAKVIAMTNKFNQILGEGSFRTVCCGKLLNGQEVVD